MSIISERLRPLAAANASLQQDSKNRVNNFNTSLKTNANKKIVIKFTKPAKINGKHKTEKNEIDFYILVEENTTIEGTIDYSSDEHCILNMGNNDFLCILDKEFTFEMSL